MKSFKTHIAQVVANVKLMFEELTTVLIQLEACLDLLAMPWTPTIPEIVSSVAGTCVKLWYDTFGRGGPQNIFQKFAKWHRPLKNIRWRCSCLARKWNGPHTMATCESYQSTYGT